MNHSIVLSPNIGLAVVTLRGQISIADRALALDALLEQLEGQEIRSILMDMQEAQAVPESFQAASEFAQRLAGERRLRECRVAYLYGNASNANGVVEKLAEARQFRSRRFEVMSEAIDWLLTPRRTGTIPALPPQQEPEPPLAKVLARLKREAGLLKTATPQT
ncbi:hypothetical protein [Agrilutibacter solisilvae]|uniref:Uncharacterized protein n=1 Tax=Agrilutibacter solisilvae TaxID=2763317 RepID=A0A974XY30_9GAMM|nr:hypothetical protein [Lysobacter solisilvae]QSX76965.1 hypothetical protein I8J32_009035 [Lysobacter solisilvae]